MFFYNTQTTARIVCSRRYGQLAPAAITCCVHVYSWHLVLMSPRIIACSSAALREWTINTQTLPCCWHTQADPWHDAHAWDMESSCWVSLICHPPLNFAMLAYKSADRPSAAALRVQAVSSAADISGGIGSCRAGRASNVTDMDSNRIKFSYRYMQALTTHIVYEISCTTASLPLQINNIFLS